MDKDIENKIISQSAFKIKRKEKRINNEINEEKDSEDDIPKDKTLLDPFKTAQAIKDSKLLDYSLDESKEKLPIFFKTESIIGNYNEKGEFKILGSVEDKI